VTNAVETEKYLLFQPHHLGAGNAHHAIEDLCTRVAQRHMSSNILLVTGPVSAGGDRAVTRKASSPTFQRRSRQQQHLHCHQPRHHPHSCRESPKIVVCALASDPNTVDAVEAAAEELVGTWLKAHSRAIADLADAARAAYSPIKATAKNPEPDTLTLPNAITVSAADDSVLYDRHVYAQKDGKFPAVLNGWEKLVVNTELAKGAVAWYRNLKGGTRAVRIPYKDSSGTFHPLYPDFVFFYPDDDGKMRVSIVDPHAYSLADTGPKWRGLSAYAAEHGQTIHRVDAVVEDANKNLLRLDLKEQSVREAFEKAGNDKAEIIGVFQSHGGKYANAEDMSAE